MTLGWKGYASGRRGTPDVKFGWSKTANNQCFRVFGHFLTGCFKRTDVASHRLGLYRLYRVTKQWIQNDSDYSWVASPFFGQMRICVASNQNFDGQIMSNPQFVMITGRAQSCYVKSIPLFLGQISIWLVQSPFFMVKSLAESTFPLRVASLRRSSTSTTMEWS